MKKPAKDTLILPGYRLTVVSWENDGDSYNTKVVDGLTKERCEFLIEAVELCRDERFGNMYDPSEAELDSFAEAAKKLYEAYPSQLEDENAAAATDGNLDPAIAAEYLSEELYDLMGCGENYYTRVLESWNVEHLPEMVVLKNANSEFRAPGGR
jgi:hypothetical protein